jgi:hypothetical protein
MQVQGCWLVGPGVKSIFFAHHFISGSCRPIELSRIFEAFTIGSYSAKTAQFFCPDGVMRLRGCQQASLGLRQIYFGEVFPALYW